MDYRIRAWKEKIEAAFRNRSETNEVDFKRDLTEDSERLKEHINAFGNSPSGGVFVFGVSRDFAINPAPLKNEEISERISCVARDSQKPPLQTNVFHVTIEGKDLLVVEVLPATTSPVFIRSRDPWSEGAFLRSGNTTQAMTENEIRDLMSRSRRQALDEEVIDEGTVEQLDLLALARDLKPFRAEHAFTDSNVKILEDNKVVKHQGSSLRPTLAGWLMFSKEPQIVRGFRNATIEFQQFTGKTRETPIRKLEIMGTLPQQVTHAASTLLQNVWKIPKLQGIRREDVPSYDETTLREVITNSVVHRDYTLLHQPVKIAMFDDRIEVENPGALMPGLTPLNLLHKRAWRNETIANLMVKAGLGEMDGQGIDRIYGVIRRLKVPAPKISADQKSFKIVLSAPKDYESYSPAEKRLTVMILLLLEQEIDNESIRNAFGIDSGKASTLLKDLVQEGVVVRTTKSMKYAKYKLSREFLVQAGE